MSEWAHTIIGFCPLCGTEVTPNSYKTHSCVKPTPSRAEEKDKLTLEERARISFTDECYTCKKAACLEHDASRVRIVIDGRKFVPADEAEELESQVRSWERQALINMDNFQEARADLDALKAELAAAKERIKELEAFGGEQE